MKPTFWWLVLAAAGACTTNDASPAGADAGADTAAPRSCTITLEGARSATQPCTLYSRYRTPKADTVVAIVHDASALVSVFTIDPVGRLAPRTYAYGDITHGLMTVTDGAAQWVAAREKGVPPNQGDWTLRIESAEVVGTEEGDEVYAPHGTLIATLPPGPPPSTATGTVKVVVTF